MKTIIVVGLLTMVFLGCAGPSDAEIERRGTQLAGRALPLMLSAGFSSERECQNLSDEFSSKLEQIEDADDSLSNRQKMDIIEEFERELDQFEEELKKAKCI